MIAAWQAAAQRYPQAVALDDPMFMGMLAPGSINSSTVEGAYVVQLGQKLPWFGKRACGARSLPPKPMPPGKTPPTHGCNWRWSPIWRSSITT